MPEFDPQDTVNSLYSLDKNQALITQSLQNILHRLDIQDKRMDSQAKDIEELKSRRFPANTISIVMMILGAIGTAFTISKGVLWAHLPTLRLRRLFGMSGSLLTRLSALRSSSEASTLTSRGITTPDLRTHPATIQFSFRWTSKGRATKPQRST